MSDQLTTVFSEVTNIFNEKTDKNLKNQVDKI